MQIILPKEENTGGPLKKYEQLISSRKIREDVKQRLAIERLQNVYENIQNYESPVYKIENVKAETKEKSSSFFPNVIDSFNLLTTWRYWNGWEIKIEIQKKTFHKHNKPKNQCM